VLHPEDSIYSPYDAANRTSHHRTDRAGTPVTFIYAMRNAAGYSLRAGGERNRERSNKSACNQDLSLHKLIPFLRWSVSLCPEITAIGWRTSISKGACELVNTRKRGPSRSIAPDFHRRA
jgi:hypothetical protein